MLSNWDAPVRSTYQKHPMYILTKYFLWNGIIFLHYRMTYHVKAFQYIFVSHHVMYAPVCETGIMFHITIANNLWIVHYWMSLPTHLRYYYIRHSPLGMPYGFVRFFPQGFRTITFERQGGSFRNFRQSWVMVNGGSVSFSDPVPPWRAPNPTPKYPPPNNKINSSLAGSQVYNLEKLIPFYDNILSVMIAYKRI